MIFVEEVVIDIFCLMEKMLSVKPLKYCILIFREPLVIIIVHNKRQDLQSRKSRSEKRLNMIAKVNPENFMQIAFPNQLEMTITMSSACRNSGGGGCYQCKCSPRRKTLGSEQEE